MTNAELVTRRVRNPISFSASRRLVATATGLFGAGLVAGLVTFLTRSATPVHQSPGTAAWPTHLALTAAAVLWYAAAVTRRRRRGLHGPLLLAPLGYRAAERAGATVHSGRTRRIVAALPAVLVMAYCCFRAGEQVTGGLDPNFTRNAWGGPSYVGAMFCHYLDMGLMVAVAGVVLNLVLLRRPAVTPGR